jgi:hypothetical protein
MRNHWTTEWLSVGILAGCGSVGCASQGTLAQTPSETSEGGESGSQGGGSSGTVGVSSGTGGGASGGDLGGGSGQHAGTGSSGNTTGANSGGSGSSGGGGSDAGDSIVVMPHGGNTCLKPVSDFSKKGPYAVTKSSVDLASYLSGEPTPTTYSIFAPSPLEPNCPAPVVVWGNGTGVTGSSTTTPAGACTGASTIDCLSGTYDFFNVYAASFGIVVLASDNSNTGSGKYHKAGADYMAKQNADSSSPFYKKLSGRVGVSGHSQGGIGATVATTLIGASCEAEVCVAGGGSPLKTTAFLCLTGTQDQAESACKSTFGVASPPAFLADWDGGTHTGTETLAGYVGGDKGTPAMMKLYAAWFRCYLADDQVACKLFSGGTPGGCGMCKDPGWADLESKGL